MYLKLLVYESMVNKNADRLIILSMRSIAINGAIQRSQSFSAFPSILVAKFFQRVPPFGLTF